MFIIGPLPNHDFTNNNGQETTNNSLNDIPKIQDYTTNSTGQTSNINVTLHQAYHNSTIININETSNSFTVPAPNATDFSSSYVDLSINDISVSNRSYTIDDSFGGSLDVTTNPCVVSFVVDRNCYLANASFWTMKNIMYAENGTMTVRLYNSTWNVDKNQPDGYSDIGTIEINGTAWKSDVFDLSITYLNNSKTDNNTWYLGLRTNGEEDFQGQWRYEADASNGDNAISYVYAGSGNWNSSPSGIIKRFLTLSSSFFSSNFVNRSTIMLDNLIILSDLFSVICFKDLS